MSFPALLPLLHKLLFLHRLSSLACALLALLLLHAFLFLLWHKFPRDTPVPVPRSMGCLLWYFHNHISKFLLADEVQMSEFEIFLTSTLFLSAHKAPSPNLPDMLLSLKVLRKTSCPLSKHEVYKGGKTGGLIPFPHPQDISLLIFLHHLFLYLFLYSFISMSAFNRNKNES